MMKDAKEWEDWDGEEATLVPRRSEEEEKYLWSMLKEVDKEVAREEKRAKAKKSKEVAKARKRMGVGKEQPSIRERFNMSNRPSNVPLVTLGQSNGLPSISPVKQGGYCGQDEHPRLKRVTEGVVESVENVRMGGPCHKYGGGRPLNK
jgi:hypothetical protein